ncbi:MAG: SprT-like domain-containing protein [Planctomycetota bacterium]|jgi:hypothetical protein
MHIEKPDLQQYFSAVLQRPVNLTITDNIRSMVSFRDDNSGGVVLRLHKMFIDAPEDVLSNITDWIKRPYSGGRKVKVFMRKNKHLVKPATPKGLRRQALHHEGKQYNLQKIFARLNADYFNSKLEMRISWGRKISMKRTRSIRMGTFCPETGIITISRKLDRSDIPKYFLCYVVYHEMLHAFLGVREGRNGRRMIHTGEFKRLEKKYKYYEKSIEFENNFFG